MKLVIFIKQIDVNQCSKRTSYDIYKFTKYNIIWKKNIILYYIFECVQLVVDNCFILQVFILPHAEVPRDLDIVPLPPGPFYIKIELFFIRQFLNVY